MNKDDHPCSEKNLKRLVGIPSRYRKATLDEFNKKMGDFGKARISLFVTGTRGIGKTHFLCACLENEIINQEDKTAFLSGQKKPAFFLPVPEFMLELKDTYNPGSSWTEKQVIDKYSKIPVLAIDDLGAEKVTDWSIQILYLLIDRRYRNEKTTLITSNLSLSEISELVCDRIASRIAEMCHIINFKGDDRRLKK